MFSLKGIVAWNKARNNVEFNAENEFQMLKEELEEFSIGYLDHDDSQMIDALCDIIVVATGAIWKLGYDPDEAISQTMLEINSRKQDPSQEADWIRSGASGKWQKDQNQDPSTLYKANYDNAKI